MIFPIYIIGASVLRKKAAKIDENYPDLKKLIDNMFDTMYSSEGVGLAAPQTGKSVRLVVIDGTEIESDDEDFTDFKKVFINAEILERDGKEVSFEEGCLSIPSIREDVKRLDRIRIKYQDENFKWHDDVFEGFKARVIQHEYDHLEGVLFTDRISPIRRRLIKNRLQALSRGKFDVKYKVRLASKR